MILKKILFIAFSALCLNGFAQSAEPTVVFHSVEDDSDVEMSPGEDKSAPAPLEVKMTANLIDDVGWTAKCEWKIYDVKVGEAKPLVDRFDENTAYRFEKSGSFAIKLYVTFSKTDEEDVEYESEPFGISISTSKLSCPDGFSPNDDGKNDVFKITYQSIVKMSGAFFNRWGQKVYSFDLSNVDKGWDGKQGGKYVKDGVYFLNLQAVGSDGIKYDIKKAVNVLKGFKEYDK